MRGIRTVAIATILVAGSTGLVQGQSATPSARSFGFASSFTARARGYEAVFWNPANLGLPGRPGWSVGLPGASAYLNNNSLSYGEIADLYGEFIDDATKSDLLADIRRDDPERMFKLSADLGAHVLGVSIGRFAFTFGTVGAADLRVSPDAMELLLFGNAGEDGTGGDFSLEGSDAQAWWFSGGALSYGQPFTIPALEWLDMSFSVGATLRYGVAHGLVRLADRGTTLTAEPLAVDVDAEVLSSEDASAGTLWAVDLGAAMDWGGFLAVGLSLQNALANVSWNEEEFELQLLRASADFDSTTSEDTTLAFTELSAEDQERVRGFLDEADVPKRLRLGGVYALSPKFTLSADYEELIGGSLRSRWDRSLSLGGELALLNALPLRIGLATDFSHFAYTGGLGIYLGPVHTDLAVGRWGVVGGDGVVGALSISLWPAVGG